MISINASPDGININDKCGAVDRAHTACLQTRVLKEKADLGIALDGDADRLILVDEKGQVIDGDQVMASIATHLVQEGRLKRGIRGCNHYEQYGPRRLPCEPQFKPHSNSRRGQARRPSHA